MDPPPPQQQTPPVVIDLNKYKRTQPTPYQQQPQQPAALHPGFRPPQNLQDDINERMQEERKPLTPEELRRNAMMEKVFAQRQQSLETQSFRYLDIFEQQMREEKRAQKEFYEDRDQQEQDNDQNKPAFFANKKKLEEPESSDKNFDSSGRPHSKKAEDVKAWKNLQKQLDMDFDPETKSQDELRDFFHLSKENNKDAVQHMNEQMFEYLYARMKERQIRFYAFLNKEFNIMNFKSARCSMTCFADEGRPLKQVNECLKLCREGITGCREYAFKLQKQAEVDVEVCQKEARNLKNLTDPVTHWIACYEKLILRFDSMENEITHEFSNFI